MKAKVHTKGITNPQTRHQRSFHLASRISIHGIRCGIISDNWPVIRGEFGQYYWQTYS